MLAAQCRVGVAVSGGADSVALLLALVDLAPRWDLRLQVLHFDHQLRPDSAADAAFTRQLAAALELPFVLGTADVRAAATAANLEETARHARLDFFTGLVRSGTLDKVATGHTLSDQAETVLFRWLRGAGSTGLAGILPVTAEGLIRPLLDVGRPEVEEFLHSRGQSWRTDATNLSLEFSRNRIRQELLPALERDYNPALTRQLAQTADLALAEEAFWAGYLEPLAERHFRTRPEGIVLPCEALTSEPLAVARRLLRLAFLRVRGDLRQIEYGHIERALALAAQREGSGRIQIPGLDVFRSFDWLRVSQPEKAPCTPRVALVPLPVPGEAELPDGTRLRTEVTPAATVSAEAADRDLLPGPLTLRYWLPGDAYATTPGREPEKIKQMFQSARIPLWERRFWPVIEAAGVIVWSRRFGTNIRFQASAGTRRLLRIEELH